MRILFSIFAICEPLMNRNLPHKDINFENFIHNIVTDFSGSSIDQLDNVDSVITTAEVIKGCRMGRFDKVSL